METNTEIREMLDELRSSPKFMPSKFWTEINAKNIEMLSNGGIHNFKRSLSQNYFNFQITRALEAPFISVLWNWIKSPTLRPFRTTIESTLMLSNVNDVDGRELSWIQRETYRLFVSLLWDTMLRHDKLKLADKLHEPSLGNPIKVFDGHNLITQDAANSIIECNTVRHILTDCANPKVAEIGAGYGRLAHVFSVTGPGKYFIFDIPPALYVSQWYLSKVLPNKKLFRFRSFRSFEDVKDEIENSDIAFLSANQLEKFPPNYFDLVLTISTLPEMTAEQVAMYQVLFSRLSKKFIFLKQWKSWINPDDGNKTDIRDYEFGSRWKEMYCKPDIVDPRFYLRAWSSADNERIFGN